MVDTKDDHQFGSTYSPVSGVELSERKYHKKLIMMRDDVKKFIVTK